MISVMIIHYKSTCTLVYVYSCRFNRFYVALLMCVISLLFIIIWPAAGGDRVRTVHLNICLTIPHPAGVIGVLVVWFRWLAAECVCICGVLQCKEAGS